MSRTALLLDEMHASAVAEALRARGHDVLCLTDRPDLRGLTDEEILAWAVRHDRRLVTENVKDLRPLLMREAEGGTGARVLFTSSRTFPRSRRNPGRLIDALDAWLTSDKAAERPAEDWLAPG